MDLFMWENTWYMLLIDEATTCTTIEGMEAEQLLESLKKSWIYMFGPPRRFVLDQQVSLMSHETAAEFERLSNEHLVERRKDKEQINTLAQALLRGMSV